MALGAVQGRRVRRIHSSRSTLSPRTLGADPRRPAFTLLSFVVTPPSPGGHTWPQMPPACLLPGPWVYPEEARGPPLPSPRTAWVTCVGDTHWERTGLRVRGSGSCLSGPRRCLGMGATQSLGCS